MYSNAKFISAIDLAKYVVWYANSKDVPITNLKLQKLLYYIQGEHLKAFGDVLFHDDIEAWEYGPVVRSVYIQYCGYGALNLRYAPDDGKLCDGISAESKQLIERVLDEKMHLSARQLIRMAQLEDPWKNHAADAIAHRKPIINNDEMALWFNKQLGGKIMTRLGRIIKVFNDYDEIVENLAWDNNDGTYERELKRLRKEVSEFIVELKLHGCRRAD